jgi:hypothetical protein
MALFERPIRSTIGGIEIDLASGLIAAGEHRLEIESTIGGIEIYIPKDVKFTIEGGAAIGGYDVHDGIPWPTRLANRALRVLRLASPLPHATAPVTAPTTIHFVIDGGIGGIDIYRV